jgi:hypothetical protein
MHIPTKLSAVVDDSPIEVEPFFKQVPVVENTTTPVVTDAQQQRQQQQPQESKSVSHVMAELLASGYILTESVVNKGAEFDEKHGVSTRVNGYLTKMGVSLTQLNQKFHSTSNLKEKNIPVNAVPIDSTNTTNTTSPAPAPAPSRMQNLMKSRASLKVQGFASRVADKVTTVHEEAKRIAVSKSFYMQENHLINFINLFTIGRKEKRHCIYFGYCCNTCK